MCALLAFNIWNQLPSPSSKPGTWFEVCKSCSSRGFKPLFSHVEPLSSAHPSFTKGTAIRPLVFTNSKLVTQVWHLLDCTFEQRVEQKGNMVVYFQLYKQNYAQGTAHGKISVPLVAWAACARASQSAQSGVSCHAGRETCWHQFLQPALNERVLLVMLSKLHELHSGVYCQDETSSYTHQVAQPSCVASVGVRPAPLTPLHAATYCKEPGGTHLHQSGASACILTFKPVDFELETSVTVLETLCCMACSQDSQSGVDFHFGLESHWQEVLHPLSTGETGCAADW